MQTEIKYQHSTIDYEVLLSFMKEVSYLFSATMDLEIRAKKMSNNAVIYQAISDKKIIAVICAYVNGDFAYVPYVVCREEMQGTGVAGCLMEYFINNVDQIFDKILLEVNCNNLRAIRFYEKWNFSIVENKDSKYLMCRSNIK